MSEHNDIIGGCIPKKGSKGLASTKSALPNKGKGIIPHLVATEITEKSLTNTPMRLPTHHCQKRLKGNLQESQVTFATNDSRSQCEVGWVLMMSDTDCRIDNTTLLQVVYKCFASHTVTRKAEVTS